MISRETSEDFIPWWPMAMPSVTVIVVNSRGVPPAALTPSFTACAWRASAMLQGAASFQQVQWIVLSYLLAVTTLIVSVGRLGDLIGRRRLLLAGLSVFTAASLLCGVAPTLWLLIAA